MLNKLFARRNQGDNTHQANPLEQWGQWVEGRLAHICMQEKLHVRATDVVRGPMTVTFTVRLLQPNRQDLQRIAALGPAFAQALHVEHVRVHSDAGGIHIEVPSPDPRTPGSTWMAKHTSGHTVAVGMDSRRNPVLLDLEAYPTVLWIAPPRRGKTEAMRSTVAAMLTNERPVPTQVVIVGRASNWQPFADHPAVLDIIGDHNTALAAANWLKAELDRRNNLARVDGPDILFVVDDLTYVVQNAPDIAGPMGDIAAAGGAVGIYQFAATHFAGSKRGTGSTVLEETVQARIIYRMTSAASAARSAGAGNVGIDQLSTNHGDALLILGNEVTRMATAYLEGERIVPRNYTPASRGEPPWRNNNQLSHQEAGEEPARHQPNTTQNRQNHPEPGNDTPPLSVENDGRPAPVPAPGVGGSGGSAGAPTPPTLDAATLRARAAAALPGALPYPDGPLLSSDAPPSPAERAVIRFLYARMESKNQLCALVYGPKNAKRWGYISLALDHTPQEAHR